MGFYTPSHIQYQLVISKTAHNKLIHPYIETNLDIVLERLTHPKRVLKGENYLEAISHLAK